MRIIALVAFVVSVASFAQGASEIVWHVMGSGATGGQALTTGVHSTLGQAVVGEATSASYRIQSGFWLRAGAASGVEEETADSPRVYRLKGFDPNPFAGTTRVSYAVPVGGGQVRITVFDVSGALVRVLVDGQVAPGRQVLLWDGKSQAGRRVASGMYLIRMEAPGFKSTGKLVLTR